MKRILTVNLGLIFMWCLGMQSWALDISFSYLNVYADARTQGFTQILYDSRGLSTGETQLVSAAVPGASARANGSVLFESTALVFRMEQEILIGAGGVSGITILSGDFELREPAYYWFDGHLSGTGTTEADVNYMQVYLKDWKNPSGMVYHEYDQSQGEESWGYLAPNERVDDIGYFNGRRTGMLEPGKYTFYLRNDSWTKTDTAFSTEGHLQFTLSPVHVPDSHPTASFLAIGLVAIAFLRCWTAS